MCNKRIKLFKTILLAAVLVMTVASLLTDSAWGTVGDLWNARVDWSDINNPNELGGPRYGSWSYHLINSDLMVQAFGDCGGSPGDWSTALGDCPNLFNNNWTPGGSHGPNEFCGHGPWMVRWTSPIDGFVEIRGKIWQKFETSRRMAYYLRQNGGIPFDYGYVLQDGSGNTILGTAGKVVFNSIFRSVSVGDTIDFIVDGSGPGGDGSSTFTVGKLLIEHVDEMEVPLPPAVVDGDVNRDTCVNVEDLACLALRWLDTGCSVPRWCEGSDIDESQEVDFGDFAYIGQNWGQCIEAGSLSFRFTGPSGSPLYVREGGFFVSDLTLKPVAYAGAFGNGFVTFNNLPDKPLLFSAYVDVPGFGDLDFMASNGGAGFLPQGQTLDVIYEVAKHRYLAANGVLQQAQAEGYVFDSTLLSQMASAESYLDSATLSPPGSALQADYALLSLGQSGPAAETIVVERGRQKLNQQGGLRPEQLVSVFSYYNVREGQQWRDAMDPLYNCGVQWMQWQFIEQANGSYDWHAGYDLDQTIQDLRLMGKKIRVQPGLWLNWMPDWWSWISSNPNERVEQLRSHLVSFTNAMVSRYPDVRYWQSVSESDASWSNLGFLEPEDIVSLGKSICEEVKTVNPDALNGINCTLVWGAHAAMNLNASPRVVSPYEHFEMLAEASTPFEFIVMQLYFNGRDIFEVDQMLEIYKQLGKKIGIESQCASAEGPMLPNCTHFPSGHAGQLYFTWHRDWDQQLQADWLEQMFIVCLSKDYVIEWSWWDLAEYVDCFYPWGGLFDENYNIKPSGTRLSELIEQWGEPAFAPCRVDENDIAGLAENWLESGDFVTGDLNYDGQINFHDFSKLVRYWHSDCPDDWPWSDITPPPPAGQAIYLEPGDAIEFTYSDAPTWAWRALR